MYTGISSLPASCCTAVNRKQRVEHNPVTYPEREPTDENCMCLQSCKLLGCAGKSATIGESKRGAAEPHGESLGVE